MPPTLVSVQVIPPMSMSLSVVAASIDNGAGHSHALGNRVHGWLADVWNVGSLPDNMTTLPLSEPGGSVDTTGIIVQTNSQGIGHFYYLPPEVSGRDLISVSVPAQPAIVPITAPVDVGLPAQAFILLPASSMYEQIGNDPPNYHPMSHYGTPQAIASLEDAAGDYIAFQNGSVKLQAIRLVLAAWNVSLPIDVLHINDISLPLGGLFDIHGDWSAEHLSHRSGKEVDIRTNHLVGDPRDPTKRVVGIANPPNAFVDGLSKRAHLIQFQLMCRALTHRGAKLLPHGPPAPHLHAKF